MKPSVINGTAAHVGFTNTPSDRARILLAMTWCMANGYDFGTTVQDHLDLRHGRDFLTEEKKYEIVILHFLFRGGLTITPDGKGNRQLAYSPHTSWSGWRKRLVNTEAKLIFVFGGMAEIGGTYIVNLDGYKTHVVNDSFWVFERL